jgi:hypothetical protein
LEQEKTKGGWRNLGGAVQQSNGCQSRYSVGKGNGGEYSNGRKSSEGGNGGRRLMSELLQDGRINIG